MNTRFTNIIFWAFVTLICGLCTAVAVYMVGSAAEDRFLANHFLAILCLFAAVPFFGTYWASGHLYNCLTYDDIALQVEYGVTIKRGRRWPTL